VLTHFKINLNNEHVYKFGVILHLMIKPDEFCRSERFCEACEMGGVDRPISSRKLMQRRGMGVER
jgi:hypothetical protein